MLDGEMEDDEIIHLDAELRASRDARALYLQFSELHSALECQAASRSAIRNVPIIPIERVLARQRQRLVRHALYAAAAVVMLSLFALWLKTAPRQSAALAGFEIGPDSRFSLSHAAGDKAPKGNALAQGSRLQLQRGTMEGLFESGVRFVIEAPCDLTLVDEDQISLAEGVAWFEVPPAAIGFTVETGQLKVVDLGTEFGIVALAGEEHEVHVIKGSVEATSRQADATNPALKLTAGEARRVDARGAFHKIPLRPASFITKLPKAVFIMNHSFEADRNTAPDGLFTEGKRQNFGGELTGWTSLRGNDHHAQVGWRNIKPQELDPYPAPSNRPAQALTLMSGASLLNVTGSPWSSLRAGDRLTLTVALGMRDGSPELHWNERTLFGLTDGNFSPAGIPKPGDTVTHSGFITVNPATGNRSGDGTFRDVSIEHTIRETDLQRPGHIGILLVASGSNPGESTHQSFFDNVRIHTREASASEAR